MEDIYTLFEKAKIMLQLHPAKGMIQAPVVAKQLIDHLKAHQTILHTFRIGDKVKLKFDCIEFPCPEMIVKKINGDEITCIWFTDHTQLEAAEFPAENLLKCTH